MADGNIEAEAVTQLFLQIPFPNPHIITVAAATVGEDEQPIASRVRQSAMKLPPIHQAVHRELGSVVGCAYRDVASVAGQIVNAKRDRDTLRITREMGIYRYRLPAPSLSLTSVVPDELLLFCIDANYRKTRFEKLRLL